MKIVGHRGARGLAPENTVASLQKGMEHHVDMIEFDLRVTKDGIVILHHNPELREASGNKLKIADYTYAELQGHKPDLTTFEAALDAVPKSLPLYVEVKPKVDTQPIVEIIKSTSGRELLLASKSQKTLVELHTALPDIPKIVIEPWSGVRAHRRAAEVGTTMISMNQLWLWWGFIKPVARRGWKLYTYTLNNPKKARRWARYGLYAVITDYPDLFDKL